ncbi:hypothetical protein Ancab_014846, partial [Ancistrocladus abbreviatus]
LLLLRSHFQSSLPPNQQKWRSYHDSSVNCNAIRTIGSLLTAPRKTLNGHPFLMVSSCAWSAQASTTVWAFTSALSNS